MLIIARNKLKFLQAGRELTIAHRNPTRYQHGRNYALGLDHRRTICRVEILEIQAAGLRVRLARHYEPIRLLAARSQYGYVDNPAQALRDEPEAINPQDLNHLASQAHAPLRAAARRPIRRAAGPVARDPRQRSRRPRRPHRMQSARRAARRIIRRDG